MKRNAGFTLIELMVVVIILAITVAMAIPSFKTLVQNNLMTTQTNRFIADIQLARSEALKRNSRIILCPSSNPTAASPTCDGTTTIWSTGWLLFANSDTNTTFDSGVDTLLRIGENLPASITFYSNTTAGSALRFNADASTNQAGATARFVLCDNRGNSYGKQIDIPPTGRPRIASTASNCTNPS